MRFDLDPCPLLTADQERRLAQRIERGDERALEQLVASNLRLVVSVAARYKYRGIPMADLIQEGSIGLVKAARKFDRRRGKFSTYAVLWIEQQIVRAVDEGGNAIRVPAAVGTNQRRVFATRERLREELDREPTRVELARGAGISVADVNRALDAARASVSLNLPRYETGELADSVRDAAATDPEERIEQLGDTEAVYAALAELDDDERRVIEARFGLGEWDGNELTPLADVGRLVSLTERRVSLCLRSAIPKLRASLAATADLSV